MACFSRKEAVISVILMRFFGNVIPMRTVFLIQIFVYLSPLRRKIDNTTTLNFCSPIYGVEISLRVFVFWKGLFITEVLTLEELIFLKQIQTITSKKPQSEHLLSVAFFHNLQMLFTKGSFL
jgi:hypothetical protein